MNRYNSLNVKWSNSQLNKLKLAIKNKTGVTLRLSSNMIGESNGETSIILFFHILHKLLLTDRQIFSQLSCLK